QRTVDDNVIGRLAHRQDAAGGGHADQQPATGSEQFLGQQNGVGRANRAADDAATAPRMLERVEIGVIAGPARQTLRATGRPQMPNDIAVGIEEADFGNDAFPDAFLAAGFAQQRLRREYRRRLMLLVAQDRGGYLRVVLQWVHQSPGMSLLLHR